MKKIFFLMIVLLTSATCYAEIIKIPLTDQIKSFMDERHYNPSEIDSLKIEPNTNGEKTYYIDGKNGNDVWDGLYPDHIPGTNHGPYKTQAKASGSYDGHRHGERIIFKSGYYRGGIGSGNLVGTADENHYNTWGPYGDGEVVIDVSMTPGLDSFEKFNVSVWRAKFNNTREGTNLNKTVGWAVMDWNYKSCRPAIGYKGTDNGVEPNRSTKLVDSTKDFINYKKAFGSGNTDLMEAYIFNITDGSWAIVTSVSTTIKPNDTLNFEPLTGGSKNKFNLGDKYAVYQLNKDGLFANVGDYFYIVSTKGEPRSRNILVNRSDWDNGFVPNYLAGKNFRFYGITFVGAPSIGLMTVGENQNVIFEKCRFMFNGKHATSQFGNGLKSVKYLKNFFYANVMMNWPRGSTWGGNGGWPNQIGGNIGEYTEMSGNISLYSGGEGMSTANVIKDNIIADAYSMLLYVGDGTALPGYDIHDNDVIYTGYVESDALGRFYLDDFYNGWQRNYVKMHPNGIMISSERSGGGTTPKNFHIYNNNVIGAWTGIGSYFEVPNAGFQDSIIENNTIITMTTQDIPPALYTDSAGIQVRARAGVDYNTFVRNNRVIGVNNADGRHRIVLVYGKDFPSISVDKNIYYFPGNESFLTDTGIKNFEQWKELTGWDKNSILALNDGLKGINWTDSSKIMKSDLQPEGPQPGPQPDPEPIPCDCPVCQECPAPPICPEPTVCSYEINVQPIKFTIKK
jgi:hypothetical protein